MSLVPKSVNIRALAIGVDEPGAGSGFVTDDGLSPMTADWNFGAHHITNLLDPVNPQDAATRAYVLASVSGATAFVKRDGSTPLTADWLAGNFRITGLSEILFDPTGGGTHVIRVDVPPTVGGQGGSLSVASGTGANGNAGAVGGDGGIGLYASGAGGQGSAAQVAGKGGSLQVFSGNGGKNNGAGGNDAGIIQVLTGNGTGPAGKSGNINMDVGTTAGGTKGFIEIGVTSASAVFIGNPTAQVEIDGSQIHLAPGGSDVLHLTAATATVKAACVLTTQTTGNINLPNNGNARVNIEGVAVSANVTAANLNELTGGGATVLHSHAAAASSGPSASDIQTGDTVWNSATYAAVKRTGATDLECAITAPSGGFVIVTFNASHILHNGAAGVQEAFFRLTLNGAAVTASDTGMMVAVFGQFGSVSLTRRIAVSAGAVSIKVDYAVVTGAAPDFRATVTTAVPRSAVSLTCEFVAT